MKKLILLLSITIFLVSLTSCVVRFPLGTKGTGEYLTKTESLEEFSKVDFIGAQVGKKFTTQMMDVEFIKSDENKIEYEAQESILEKINIKVEDGKLKAYFGKKYSTNRYITDHITCKVYIKDINEIESTTINAKLDGSLLNDTFKLEISGAASYEIDTVALDDFKLITSGASKIKIDNMNVKKLSVVTSGASELSVKDLTLEDANIELSGASKMYLYGNIKTMDLEASGASKIEIGNCDDLKAALSGASVIKTGVLKTLDADLSGASKIKYAGTPEVKKLNLSGASKAEMIEE